MLSENNWLCVFQALSFPFQGGFPGGEPHLHMHTVTYFWSLLMQTPSLYFIIHSPTHPCVFQKTHTSGTISLFGIFYVTHCFFLKVVENWDLPQSRKAGNHGDNLGKKAIWRGKKKKKNEEEYKQVTTLSNYFSNGN